MAARAVPAFYLHFIYCGMQFAVVANELNMRIAIIPKENEKSEPFSNRKQVRIFLVWWARVDYASRAAKNSLAGCFCPAGRKAPGRSCSHPPAYVSLTFAQKKTASVPLHQRFFHGRGWITQAAHLKRPRRGLFAAGTYSGGRCCSNPPLRRFTNFRIKQKLQCHYNTGVLGGAKQPKSEPLPSGASLAAISSKVMVFVPSL